MFVDYDKVNMMCAISVCYLVIIFLDLKVFFWVKLLYFLVVNNDILLIFNVCNKWKIKFFDAL